MMDKIVVKASGPVADGKAPGIIQDHIDRFVTMAVMFLDAQVKMRTPIGVYGAQGGLLSTIKGEVAGKGTPLIRGMVTHGSPYGDVIEKGRSAGKGAPPKGTLLRWIEVKLNVDEKTAQRLEYVIRRKIGQKGFDGTHMFEKALTENWSTLQAMAASEGLSIARELNG